MTNLSGKTALVTGASRGIGRASALALAQGGVHRSSFITAAAGPKRKASSPRFAMPAARLRR